MIVLTGPEGIRKSMLLEALSSGPGPWAYCETLGDIRNPQHYIPSISGPWLVEEGELATFSRRQVGVVKHFLTVKVDRARPAYGRRAIDYPRRCVFAGTSNPHDFLTDPSGNRRFWPIDVSELDIDYLYLIREQLFAEAVAAYRSGEVWYLGDDARKEAEEVQTDHLVIDPWTDLIREWLDGPAPADMDFDFTTDAGVRNRVTTNDVLCGCLDIPAARVSVGDQRRVSAILKRLGWQRIRVRNTGGQTWAFDRPKIAQ
jgi:predicted P-loop ATPase